MSKRRKNKKKRRSRMKRKSARVGDFTISIQNIIHSTQQVKLFINLIVL